MMNIAVISGSARPERQSHQVAVEVKNSLDKLNIRNWLFDVKELNLPLLDYTYDKHPAPGEILKQLKNKLDHTDAFIIVSPEHNGSFSGALKNTMDYFYKEYAHKVFGIVTVSSGVLGGINALKNLQHYVLKLNGIVAPEFLITPQVQKLFTNQQLTDESYGQRMNKFLDAFVALAEIVYQSKEQDARQV
ncbi:NAD(P)H-dependent oxidoreductase [Pontibacter sp. 172403-2]|uniref:NADPH-dependent FMN reductase n=1 Tax=Pontibacter rufus TaxID=2791028 RepID=UPI0018AFABB5|nr:NADPH-dependent FMN reductase [Pontibacter sp. 172403-2]MBF9254259.1 NAD(P)H-dependent oxidoreductase [Pontibacter sp. 172403-2]